MKHSIRQRVINEYGLPVVKIMQIDGELGSGFKDRNGREIFEGDKVRFDKEDWVAEFVNGHFGLVSDDDDWRDIDLCTNCEVIGHAVIN